MCSSPSDFTLFFFSFFIVSGEVITAISQLHGQSLGRARASETLNWRLSAGLLRAHGREKCLRRSSEMQMERDNLLSRSSHKSHYVVYAALWHEKQKQQLCDISWPWSSVNLLINVWIMWIPHLHIYHSKQSDNSSAVISFSYGEPLFGSIIIRKEQWLSSWLIN